MAKQENMVNDYSCENQCTRRKKCVFRSATSISPGYHDSLLSVSASFLLHLSNPQEKKLHPVKACCACISRLLHHHVFPARFTPKINTTHSFILFNFLFFFLFSFFLCYTLTACSLFFLSFICSFFSFTPSFTFVYLFFFFSLINSPFLFIYFFFLPFNRSFWKFKLLFPFYYSILLLLFVMIHSNCFIDWFIVKILVNSLIN